MKYEWKRTRAQAERSRCQIEHRTKVPRVLVRGSLFIRFILIELRFMAYYGQNYGW